MGSQTHREIQNPIGQGTTANREIVAQRLPIKVNARNGYGGYGGATWYDCYLSRASNQVFMVVAR
ncbi:hypothetical protein McPS_23050 [Marichromatium sp. PS1]